MKIVNLTNVLPDGKYMMGVELDIMYLTDTTEEVYDMFIVDNHDGTQIVNYANMNNQVNSEKLLPASVQWKNGNTIILHKGSVTIEDVHGRKVFSMRPDGFHYSFEYNDTMVTNPRFPCAEKDSDGTIREYVRSGAYYFCTEYGTNHAYTIRRLPYNNL